MFNIVQLQHIYLLNFNQSDLVSGFYRFVSLCFQNVQRTCLLSFAVQMILFLLSKNVVGNYISQNGNRRMYRSCHYLRVNTRGYDISTYRLWYAMFMTMRSRLPFVVGCPEYHAVQYPSYCAILRSCR